MRLCRLGLTLLVLATPAVARANDHTASFFLGPGFASGSTLPGLHATLEVSFPPKRVHDFLGFVADISVHGGTSKGAEVTRATFLGGVRVSDRYGAHVPSGHVLVGVVRSHGPAGADNNIAVAFGGGYELVLGALRGQSATANDSTGWSVRAQADYIRQQSLDGFGRVSVGLAYRFKQ